jgi:hypothetical protein
MVNKYWRCQRTRCWGKERQSNRRKRKLHEEFHNTQQYIQKFLDWLPGVRTANGIALCHYVQLYCYSLRQSSEFCCHNHLYCFSMNVYCCKHIFRYQHSLETFGYTLVRSWSNVIKLKKIGFTGLLNEYIADSKTLVICNCQWIK